jgi:hypothetical protein
MVNKFKNFSILFGLLLLVPPNIAGAENSYFSGYILQVHKTALLAMESQSLEDLQGYARKTMEFANDFQQAAQTVNDSGYVSQAVDIYTYAQRALMSSTMSEAREYIARVESYARLASDQIDESAHDPEFRRNYNDFNDSSYRNYYDTHYDIDYDVHYQ